jgi:1-acyl-sn-glycerol-3-phosphate acyltransferase
MTDDGRSTRPTHGRPSHARPLYSRLWYDNLQVLCRLAGVVVFRTRWHGRWNIPPEGGGLVLSNHQSHLDPVLVGMAFNRRLNYLARDSLFGFAPFRWLINSLDAIPIDREGLGMSGLKETLRRLKRQELVLIFPEGTRTRDGQVGPLKPGFCALARRARVPLLPVAMDGAFQAWPRWRNYPLPGVIHVQVGAPILPHEVERYADRELVAEVSRRIRACHAEARRLRLSACGRRRVTDDP